MKIDQWLGIRYPFIQGGMAHIATGRFAAAVSNAGGLGMIGTGGMSAKRLEKEIELCKSLTDRPFGVNVVMLNREIDAIAELIEAYAVPVVTTGAGNPAAYVARWQAQGSKVLPVIASPAMAKRMEKVGVDGIIAEGQEAGGHIGELSTMVLLPQVAEAVSLPVIAAGGIATGRQVLAAEVLGAVGVQMGTALLSTTECPIHERYKKRVCEAKSSQVTVIGRIGGLPTRVLKNDMTRQYIQAERAGATWETLEKMTLHALRRAVVDGDVTEGSVMCGEVVGAVTGEKSLATFFADLYAAYEKERSRLCQK